MPLSPPAPRPAVDLSAPRPYHAAPRAASCLNCSAALAGPYCADCGQRAVQLDEPTWEVVREAVADATDVDGRLLRTVRALVVPGLLTAEFLRGRRVAYVGPLKLFLVAGAVLSTTWILTRGVDAAFYGYRPDANASAYIDTFVHGLLFASLAVALGSWALALGRRRLLDDAVFALHVVGALALGGSVVLWLATGLKALWGSVDRMPEWLPAFPVLVFLPALVLALVYMGLASRRAHGGAWWAVTLRTLLLVAIAFWAVTTGLVLAQRMR